MLYEEAVRQSYEELVLGVVESLRKQKGDFKWCPSLDAGKSYDRDELIHELVSGTPVGQQFLKVTVSGTVTRMAGTSK